MLNELAKKCQEISNSKGFHTDWDNINTKLLLVVVEIAEATEEIRAGRREVWYSTSKDGRQKPEGFPIEIADAVIRLFELSSSLGIDLDAAYAEKMAYNQGREFRHGKLY